MPDASSIRIGWGYDIHGLFDGHPTVLAGVEFPDFPRGFNTHSDGDVVAHAIIDALAGALAVGSIGDHFPENDPADQDARSIEFLDRFRPVMRERRAEVINLDCTISCALPRIGPVADQMCENIAAGLGCSADRVNVKGKTNDGLGAEGRGEAISATVLAHLERGSSEPISMDSDGLCEVIVTAPNREWLDRLCRELVEHRLAASAHVLHPVTSIYRWDGHVQAAAEARALLRSRQSLVAEIAAYVVERHPYDVPNITALPILGGNPAYLDWVRSATKARGD